MRFSDMTTTSKSLLAFAVIGALAGIIAFFGFSPFGKTIVQETLSTSPVGTTFNTAKFAGVVIDLSTNTGATSTSIINGDTSDRYVTEADVSCNNVGNSFTAVTGAGLANLTLSIGTSTTASPVAALSVGSWGRVASAITVSTTTAPIMAIASSTTQLATSTKPVVWHAGEYMTFYWNATNTPATGYTSVPCTEGVKYIGS